MRSPADAESSPGKSRALGSDLRADREKAVASEMRPYQTPYEKGPDHLGPDQAAPERKPPFAGTKDSVPGETPQRAAAQTFSLDSLSPGERDSLEATARKWIAEVLRNHVASEEPPEL